MSIWLRSAASVVGVLVLGVSQARGYAAPRSGAEAAVDWTEPAWATDGFVGVGPMLRRVPSTRRRSYALAHGRENGFTRVHIAPAARLDVAILFRATRTESAQVPLRGYGLALVGPKERMMFLRWDEGGVRDPGVSVDVPGMAQAHSLEALLWTAGSTFSAVLLDGQSKHALGVLTWSDATYASGALGIYSARGTSSGTTLTWSQMAPVAPAAPTRLAREWTVAVKAGVEPRIPASVRQLYTARSDGERTLLVTSERGVAALRVSGVPLEQVRPGVPYRLRPHNTSLYDWREVEVALHALAERYPARTRLVEVGRTAQGRALWALRVATSPDDLERPAVLLIAAHHANEASTPSFVLDAVRVVLERADSPPFSEWLARMTLVAVPMANPDGSEAFWHVDDGLGRKNQRAQGHSPNPGVDLNRNYPFRFGGEDSRYNTSTPSSDFYRGPSAASEPEVQALIALARRERFVAAISYHEAATRVLVPYTIDGVANPSPSAAWAIGEAMVARLPHVFAGRRYETTRALYPVSGTEQDWYHHELGTMAYLIEVPYRRAKAHKLSESIENSRPAWMYLFERWLAGPSVSVRVRDGSTGSPVAAQVVIDEVELRAGEVWQAGPHGVFHHYLPGPGRYTVRAWEGARRAFAEVEVKGHRWVELTLGGSSNEEDDVSLAGQ